MYRLTIVLSHETIRLWPRIPAERKRLRRIVIWQTDATPPEECINAIIVLRLELQDTKTRPRTTLLGQGATLPIRPPAPPNGAADGYFRSCSGAAKAAGWTRLWSHAVSPISDTAACRHMLSTLAPTRGRARAWHESSPPTVAGRRGVR
eukprot:7380071-Prymnesium_polylepis.1